jgi:peptide-methionine (R)-S-oxide reductase
MTSAVCDYAPVEKKMRPLEPANVLENVDSSHGMTRNELRSKLGDSHLGHVFANGPCGEGGLT